MAAGEPVWRALAERAEVLGWTVPAMPVTGDPDPHILAGSRRIDPLGARDGRYVFAIPAGEGPWRLVTRAARPSQVTPWVDDPRRLGVLVRRLMWRDGADARDVPMDGPGFERGWWDVEWHAQEPCRWTNGDAMLPDMGGRVVEVTIGGTLRYPVDGADVTPPPATGEAEAPGSAWAAAA